MKKTNLLTYLITIFLTQPLFAAKVVQSKNGKIMIDLEGETAQLNQNIILINNKNKKVAIAQINQIKNGKAIATITKGQSQGNEKVSFSSSNTAQSTTTSEVNQVYRTNSKKMSLVATLMSNTMTTKQSDNVLTEDVGMKGSTFGITGVVDWPVFKSLVFRGTLGYEPFKASGSSTLFACDNGNSKDCSAEISYLSAGGYARYDFTQSRTQFWGAAGGTLKYPISKTTTALKSGDIQTTMTYGAALGLDFFLNNKNFIPFSIEQQFFLKSDTVSAGITFIRLGYGQAF